MGCMAGTPGVSAILWSFNVAKRPRDSGCPVPDHTVTPNKRELLQLVAASSSWMTLRIEYLGDLGGFESLARYVGSGLVLPVW